MAIYLIRHGHAGSRSGWTGDDYQRPLSDRGERQAEHLAAIFEDATIGLVLSSPARRCVETGQPLADQRGLAVEIAGELGEGSDPQIALALLLRHAADGVAAVSHGDVIPAIIRRLNAGGMRSADPNLSQKGSAWVLEVDNGKVVRGAYHPPPKH